MDNATYEITVRGRLSAGLACAFDGFFVTPSPAATVIRGQIDRSALHGVLERIDALGLELLDVRRAPLS